MKTEPKLELTIEQKQAIARNYLRAITTGHIVSAADAVLALPLMKVTK